jgi:NDP-sugar pyrophosphorylase family protein
MLPVAVLAGGLGTRLRDVTGDLAPKVLVPVRGRPFLDYKLEGLASAGLTDVVLLVGHHGERIRSHVGDGRSFGLRVTCLDDGLELRGTGGALLQALPRLGEQFWVTYGDTLVQFDVAQAEAAFHRGRRRCLMTVLPARSVGEPPEPSNARVEGDLVVEYAKDPRPEGADHVDYGMLALHRDTLTEQPSTRGFDLADLLTRLARARDVTAFEVSERFHDVGTPEALAETEKWLAHQRPLRGPARRGR